MKHQEGSQIVVTNLRSCNNIMNNTFNDMPLDNHKQTSVNTDLCSPGVLKSIRQNDNSSDSDDLFEDITLSKNITFSRSKIYYPDECQLYPMTPIIRRRSKGGLNSEEKENLPAFNSSLICREQVLKDLELRKTTPTTFTPLSKNSRDTSLNKSKRNSSTRPRSSQNIYALNSAGKNEGSPVNISESDLESIRTFEKGLDSNNLGATSTPSNSSGDFSRIGKQSLHESTKNGSTSASKPSSNSFLFQSSSCTPKTSNEFKISSIKKYSLMKAALSAQEIFENIVKNVEKYKDSKTNGQTNTNATPEVEQTAHNNVSSKGSLSGVKRMISITKDRRLLNRDENETNLQLQGFTNLEDDEDLPCTQPASSILLRGIVAYVEIKSGKEYRSEGTKAELQSLGAKVENNFTKKVTHCFFHWGKMSTYRRAVEWKVPLVSTLWIEECKAEQRVVPIEGWEPYGIDKYKEELPMYRLKTKMRRPMTDSKIPAKPWKVPKGTDKAIQVAAPDNGPSLASDVERNNIVDQLHSVAGDIKKASHQFHEILKRPILQRRSKQQNDVDKNVSKDKTLRKNSENNKKPNKKLVFSGSSEDERTCSDNNVVNKISNEANEEIRFSYDSDDLLAYAKKQAALTRCSAPSKLLTNRKCKKLLSSCSKQPVSSETAGTKSKENETSNINCITTNELLKTQELAQKQSDINKAVRDKVSAKRPKTRKRKLLRPSQTIAEFQQDSRESTPDISNQCPYKATPNKKRKTTQPSKKQFARPAKLAPLMSNDWDSDDSLTRAARRESSALFVKKQKNANPQRNIPTIVCTSLHRRDVEFVASIVSTLGKFVVEGSVSERTTHVITNSPRRTINLLKGIARGCWILNIKWVYESMESGKWLLEERFELLEFSHTVRQARIERQAFGPEFCLELFKGVGPIYVCRTTVPPHNDLTELIRLCGGIVVSSARAAKIIIGTSVLCLSVGYQPLMVKEKWVLDSISQLTQLNPHNYKSAPPEP